MTSIRPTSIACLLAFIPYKLSVATRMIGMEGVVTIILNCKFIATSASERILKIGKIDGINARSLVSSMFLEHSVLTLTLSINGPPSVVACVTNNRVV